MNLMKDLFVERPDLCETDGLSDGFANVIEEVEMRLVGNTLIHVGLFWSSVSRAGRKTYELIYTRYLLSKSITMGYDSSLCS